MFKIYCFYVLLDTEKKKGKETCCARPLIIIFLPYPKLDSLSAEKDLFSVQIINIRPCLVLSSKYFVLWVVSFFAKIGYSNVKKSSSFALKFCNRYFD